MQEKRPSDAAPYEKDYGQRLQAVMDSGQPDAIVAGTLDKYLDASRLASEIAAKAGAQQSQVKRLRNAS